MEMDDVKAGVKIAAENPVRVDRLLSFRPPTDS